jgi:hypothetical protein
VTRPLAVLIASIALVFATRTASAQLTREWGAQVTAVSGRPAFLGAGGVWGWRPGTRDRVVIHGALGAAEHQVAARVEASWQFMLSPQTERGVGAYVGGGIAGQFAATSHGWLMLTAGLEQNPGRSRGWSLELGIGGGIRVAAGYRWRR